jgi:uncharacterized protein YfaQ (DUF2300 family)
MKKHNKIDFWISLTKAQRNVTIQSRLRVTNWDLLQAETIAACSDGFCSGLKD